MLFSCHKSIVVCEGEPALMFTWWQYQGGTVDAAQWSNACPCSSCFMQQLVHIYCHTRSALGINISQNRFVSPTAPLKASCWCTFNSFIVLKNQTSFRKLVYFYYVSAHYKHANSFSLYAHSWNVVAISHFKLPLHACHIYFLKIVSSLWTLIWRYTAC